MIRRERLALRLIRSACAVLVLVAIVCGTAAAQQSSSQTREIELSVLEDKIRGGWAGQMVGVAYGAPTEFRWLGRIVEGEIKWDPGMAKDSLNQDDLYVEMTFAEVMDREGLDATTEQYGEAFRDSKYNLWHANAGARRHLNNGVKAPMSGHPEYNIHANDIDFQIESDFIGLMTPGMPQRAIELCDRVGRVMNYGDGLYGGTFVTTMYSAAFFETDPRRIVEAGVACLPEGSGYRAIIEDTLEAFDRAPDDWQACWRAINEKWDKNDPCPSGALHPFNIDARLNGAYIAIGMLYGGGDFAKTMEISTRCGQDSDCNPSSAAGILGVVLGFDALDDKWVGGIAGIGDTKFRFTNYSFEDIVASTMKRTFEAVRRSGGEVKDDRIVIPIQNPVPPELEQWSMGIPEKIYAADDPAWKWSEGWEKGRSGPSYSLRRREGRRSSSAGNEATLEFTGSAISLVGYLTQDGGKADVYLDGKKVGQVNSFIVIRTTDNDLWHAYGLEDGPHKLRIVTLDDPDPRSDGNRVNIQRAIAFRSDE